MTIKLDPSMIQASGTPSGSNYLRGDGSWGPLIIPPIWSTQAGSIALANEQAAFTTTVLAVDVNNLTLSYTVTSGALPPGLTLNSSTGVISGTTTQVTTNTTSTFTISVSNGTNSTPRVFSITVNNSTNEPPVWGTATGTLGTINMNSSFNYSLSATDPNSDTLSYSITSGSLPAGLSMSSLGVITGTTSTIGITTTSSFTVSVNDGHGGTVTRDFSITVNGPANKHFLFGVDTNGTPGVMYVSTDANSWTKVTNNPFYAVGCPIWSITKSTSTGMYVAGGSGFLCTSMDGINWTTPTSQLNTTLNHEYAIQGLCYGNGIFIACGGWHGQYAQRSTDGVTWTDISTATRAAGISYVNKTTVAYGNGKFVMHNYYGGTAWSTDGITWTSVSSAPGYGELLFANGRFFVGMYGTSYYHSTDGINWTSASIPGTGSSCKMSFNGTTIFAGTMSISSDGLNWTNKSSTYTGPGSGGNAFLSASTTAIVAVGYSSTTVSKSFNNGDSWTTDGTVQFGYSGAVYVQGNATEAFWC